MFDKNKNSWRPKGYRKDENPREHNDANKPVFNGGARPRFSEFSQDNRADNNGRQRPRFKRDMSSTQPRSERVHTSRMGEKVNYYGATDKERISRPRFTEQSNGTTFRPNVKRNANVYSKKKAFEYKQAYEDPTKPIRLNKYLANAGICSRREADDFIQAGVITVNGEVVENLGAKVLPTDKVMFHNQPVRREKKVYILLNKPKNTVTTTDDPEERRTVLDIVRNACAERIYPVGRLDRNTTGVLLLTNDGDLAAKLTHPKFGKKKIYAVTLDRELLEDDEQLLRDGIVLDDERIVPDALEFPKEDRLHIGLEIHSGQNRVVRRMFEKVGYKVMQLDRVSFAGLTKKNVARGKYRFLTPKEVSMLQMGAFE